MNDPWPGAGSPASNGRSRSAAFSARFDASTDAPRRARSLAQHAASTWGLAESCTADLLVVVSELMSNAVEHARTSSTLVLRLAAEVVHVAVTDASSTPPVVRPHDLLAARGRGMQVIAAMSVLWGWEPTGDGKTVWAEVPAGP